jgi:hypothetical protein
MEVRDEDSEPLPAHIHHSKESEPFHRAARARIQRWIGGGSIEAMPRSSGMNSSPSSPSVTCCLSACAASTAPAKWLAASARLQSYELALPLS